MGGILFGSGKKYYDSLKESCLLRMVKLIFTKAILIKPEKTGPSLAIKKLSL